MNCIILKSPLGERKVLEGEPYQLMIGEYIDGVDYNCSGDEVRDVDTQLEKAGIKWGDTIAWVTKRLGIKQCAPCKARQEILNHASEHGWKETLRQIKGTF